MYTRGDRQFSRGGVSTNQRPDPANRHRRKFHRYVRRRNHSGGGAGGSYGRGGSFSDDRNDSSSPPIQMNRHQANANDEPQQQQQQQQLPQPSSASPYVQQQPSYPQQQQQSSKVQHRSSHRGSRKSHYDSRHSRNDQQKQERPFYDNTSMYLSSRNQQSSRNAYADGSDNDYNENIGSVDQQQEQQHHHQQQHQQQQQQQQQQNHGYSNRKIDELTKSFHAQKTEIDDIKLTLSKLTLELDQVKSRIKESESNINNIGATNSKVTTNNQQSVGGGDLDDKPNKVAINRRKIRVKREKRTAKSVEKRAADIISKPLASQQERQKQILNSTDSKQTAPAAGNSDKQTEPSTNNQGRYQDRRRMKKAALKTKSFPELTESELNEIVQNLKREFINLERPIKSIKNTMNDKGPKVAYEFAVSILDHAICDVTSPTKLSEISNNLYQLIVSKDNTSEVDFQQGFYDALKDISKREDDIAIDAPRYLDTLGQVLADCIVPMNGKHSNLMRKFLKRSLESYDQKNRGALLANIMKGVAGIKSERFAKQVFDNAQLNWNNILMPETDLKEFLESHCVAFLARAFSPETRESEKAPKELEKFADDVTDLVEKKSTAQSLNDFVKDLNFPKEDQIEYLGTLAYAIVRGCIITDSGSYKLDKQALKEYSSILSEKHDQQDAIALHALTALTILWHSYNCPKDLFLQMLVALHNYGTASNEALVEWLNSENLTNIPGIGAARCGDSKRYIEQLEGNQKKLGC